MNILASPATYSPAASSLAARDCRSIFRQIRHGKWLTYVASQTATEAALENNPSNIRNLLNPFSPLTLP